MLVIRLIFYDLMHIGLVFLSSGLFLCFEDENFTLFIHRLRIQASVVLLVALFELKTAAYDGKNPGDFDRRAETFVRVQNICL